MPSILNMSLGGLGGNLADWNGQLGLQFYGFLDEEGMNFSAFLFILDGCVFHFE